MLEYERVCATFESVFALPLNFIYYFRDSFKFSSLFGKKHFFTISINSLDKII
jgi:hypothetical protein